jgi:hypothetical protein
MYQDETQVKKGHGHGHGNPNHHLKVLHDLRTVLAHINSSHDIEGYLRTICSIEAKRVEAHIKDIEELRMRQWKLLSIRPTILHLVEQDEWIKRIELVSFLRIRKVKI